MDETGLKVSVTFGDRVIFAGSLDLPGVIAALSHVAPDRAAKRHVSFPITPDQAEQLLRKVDGKTAMFLKALAQNDGELTFGEMQVIFGIKEWTEYTTRYGKGLTRALRHLTDNSSATLVWWIDDEWESDNDPNGPVYLDGEALTSIQAATGVR